MKKLCDHKSYCGDDNITSIYIGMCSLSISGNCSFFHFVSGQEHHIATPSYRYRNDYFPPGWDKAPKYLFNDMCFYSANHSPNGNFFVCGFSPRHLQIKHDALSQKFMQKRKFLQIMLIANSMELQVGMHRRKVISTCVQESKVSLFLFCINFYVLSL